MKLALFGKSISKEYLPYMIQLMDKLKEYNCELLVYQPFLEDFRKISDAEYDCKPFKTHEDLRGVVDMVFSIGGDGTLLSTVSFVRDSGIPVLGINLGRLGFLSSISRDDIIPAVEMVMKGEYTLDQRTLMQLKAKDSLFDDFKFALNDLTVNRKNSTSLIVVHVYVDDIFLNSYWADGLIVATPTGSTAYSLSSGGPIVSPGSENFLITPIAPHNLTIRPIVISDKSVVKIRVEGRDKNFMVSMDSKTDVIQADDELLIRRADFKFNLVKIEHKDFYTTIRDKLKWGLDARN